MSVPPRRRTEHFPYQSTMRLPGRPPRQRPGPARGRAAKRRHGCGMLGIPIILLLVLVFVGGGAYAYQRWIDFVGKTKIPDIVQNEVGGKPSISELEPFNLLLVGYDYRSADPSEGARSDTLILVHVDPRNKWASMLSIPRDSYTCIPRTDNCTKINAAYSHGFNHPQIYGTNVQPTHAAVYLARETVESFLNLEAHGTRIDYVAQVDFDGFRAVVDAIGGINVDVPKPLLDPEYPSDDGDNGYIRLYIPAGPQHMDGITALRYARSRHADSDFGRSQRQQQVLQAILKAMRERGFIDKIIAGDNILNELKDTIATDLPIDDIPQLRAMASLAGLLSGDRLVSLTINPQDVGIDQEHNGSMIVWNENDLSALVRRWLVGDGVQTVSAVETVESETPGTVRVQVYNGTAVNGLAGQVASYLGSQLEGVEMLSPATAAQRYDNSLLIDYTGRKDLRQQLAQILGIKSTYVRVQPDDAPPNPDEADLVLILGRDYDESWRGAGGN